jgi:hypothetical protein
VVVRINTGQKPNRADKIPNWTERTKSLPGLFRRILCIILFFNFVQAIKAFIPAPLSVNLAWNASLDPNVIGYRIYSGVASDTYTNKVDVGNVTNTTIPSLVAGVTYYFAATAYDSFGQESGFSNEASYLVPLPVQSIQIRATNPGQFIMTLTGQMDRTYEVQATQDFKIWTVVTTLTMGTDGSLDFVDTNTLAFPNRFYRTRNTLP